MSRNFSGKTNKSKTMRRIFPAVSISRILHYKRFLCLSASTIPAFVCATSKHIHALVLLNLNFINESRVVFSSLNRNQNDMQTDHPKSNEIAYMIFVHTQACVRVIPAPLVTAKEQKCKKGKKPNLRAMTSVMRRVAKGVQQLRRRAICAIQCFKSLHSLIGVNDDMPKLLARSPATAKPKMLTR